MTYLNFLLGVFLTSSTVLAFPNPAAAELNDLLLAGAEFGSFHVDESGNITARDEFGSLTTRATPGTCLFGSISGVGDSYNYISYPDISTLYPNKKGSMCVGWETFTEGDCNIPWGDTARDNIIHSINTQITKDGQFKTSSSGAWDAAFGDLTTAFADRDTRPFHDVITTFFARPNTGKTPYIKYSKRYFYGRKAPADNQAEAAQTHHSASTCP